MQFTLPIDRYLLHFILEFCDSIGLSNLDFPKFVPSVPHLRAGSRHKLKISKLSNYFSDSKFVKVKNYQRHKHR